MWGDGKRGDLAAGGAVFADDCVILWRPSEEQVEESPEATRER